MCRDREVTLVVTSEVDGILHIHGYDVEVPATEVTAGEVTELAFTARRSGQFPIELHTDENTRVLRSASSPSMNPRIRLATLAAGLVVVATPWPAAAHAIGGTFQLPVPLWLYLAGAGAAVAASFVVTARTARTASTGPSTGHGLCPAGLAGAARTALRVLGLAWWYGAIQSAS